MKRTALLAVAAFLVTVGSATAAPAALKGVVVAKHRAKGTVVLATGRNGLGVTVRLAVAKVRLGDRVSLVGRRLSDGTIRASHLRVLSHVKRTTIRAVVVKRLAHGLRVASGHSLLTIHSSRRALAAHGDGGMQAGAIGEFTIGIEQDGLVEEGVTDVSQSGTARIDGRLVSTSPLVVSLEGLPIEITVPSGMTLPPLTPGQEVELVVQTGTGNAFTLVSIQSGDNADENEVEAKGTVTDSTTSQITIDTGEGTLTFAAPAGVTLPVLPVGTLVEAHGVTIDGVLTLTQLQTEEGDGGGDGG